MKSYTVVQANQELLQSHSKFQNGIAHVFTFTAV